MLRGLRVVAAFGHDRDGGEDGNAGLADGHNVRAGSDLLEEADDVIDVLVGTESSVGEAHVARVVPVGQIDIVLGQHRADGGAQQRCEVSRHRRDDEHARERRVDVLLEVQQRRERRRVGNDFLDRHRRIADLHRIDAERRAGVTDPGARQHLVARRDLPHAVRRERLGDRIAQQRARVGCPVAHLRRKVGLRLIHLIHQRPPVGRWECARVARSIGGL